MAFISFVNHRVVICPIFFFFKFDDGDLYLAN